MPRDSRWPFVPFIIVRGVQLVFAIIVLGMTSHVTSVYEDMFWWSGMGVFTSLVAMLFCITSIVLLFMNLALPLALLIVDAFLAVFYLISMAGTASSGILSSDCTYSYSLYYSSYTYTSAVCMTAKGSFALELLSMFLFIASTALSAITLHKTCKDLRGKKHAQGLPPVSSAEQGQSGAVTAPMQMQDQKVNQPYYPQQQQQQPQPQPHVQPPQQAYVQGPPVQFVSPPTSPGPEYQHTGHQTVSPLYTDPSGGAHEMPGTGYQTMPPAQGHAEVPGTGHQQPQSQQMTGRSEMSGY